MSDARKRARKTVGAITVNRPVFNRRHFIIVSYPVYSHKLGTSTLMRIKLNKIKDQYKYRSSLLGPHRYCMGIYLHTTLADR